jgi:hypothetical protein
MVPLVLLIALLHIAATAALPQITAKEAGGRFTQDRELQLPGAIPAPATVGDNPAEDGTKSIAPEPSAEVQAVDVIRGMLVQIASMKDSSDKDGQLKELCRIRDGMETIVGAIDSIFAAEGQKPEPFCKAPVEEPANAQQQLMSLIGNAKNIESPIQAPPTPPPIRMTTTASEDNLAAASAFSESSQVHKKMKEVIDSLPMEDMLAARQLAIAGGVTKKNVQPIINQLSNEEKLNLVGEILQSINMAEKDA